MEHSAFIIGNKDKSTLRSLAARVAELAALPEQKEKRELWYRHNALEATRPVIFCDPENGWNEIITTDQIVCENVLARQWEFHLRKEIFWGESMGDDRVIVPFFNVSHVFEQTDWGMHETVKGGKDGGSFAWDAPLKSYSDLDRIHFPMISVDYEKSNNVYELANDILGDLLKVQVKSGWWWTLGLTQVLVKLRGLEQIMLDMYDYPEELHRLMELLRDGHLVLLDFVESKGLLCLNNDGTYVGSGGFGYSTELPQKDFDGLNVRTCDIWGFAESQETSLISPDMFSEFIFPYQLPILERFGLNCYGCCEALNKRWKYIEKIPRLRRVSVSPWADLADMADKLTNRYIYSMKPNPAHLAVSHMDGNFVRNSLREAMKITQNCRVEVIMKDNNTIGRNPQNVIDWCRIAREEAEAI